MSSPGSKSRLVFWIPVCLMIGFATSVFVPVSQTASLEPGTLPADGHTSARLRWSLNTIYGSPVPFYPFQVSVRWVSGRDKLRIVGAGERESLAAELEFALQGKGRPGIAYLELDTGLSRKRFSLDLRPSSADGDLDGLPDEAELHSARDRQAFRDWFAAISEAQFYSPDPRWQPVHRDCAGLVRFAFKEALRKHDKRWLKATPYLHSAVVGDVSRYNYPQVPVLGDLLFRTNRGIWRSGDLARDHFSSSANAMTLWQYNTVLHSRDPERGQRGDLLFFRDEEQQDSPMHTMVLLDPPQQGERRRVVYHTGGSADELGEVRLVQLADLNAHRDSKWHIKEDNPNFLGIYRWKILEGGHP